MVAEDHALSSPSAADGTFSEWNLRGSWMDAVVSCLVRSQSQVGLHTPWRPGREMTPLCQCTSTSWTGSMVLLRAAWLSQRVAGVECASPRGSTSECSQDGKCVLFMHAYGWNMYHNWIGSILLTHLLISWWLSLVMYSYMCAVSRSSVVLWHNCVRKSVKFNDKVLLHGGGKCGKNDYQPLLAMECLKLATDLICLTGSVHLPHQGPLC